MTMDLDAQAEIRQVLDSTERLLWAGKPKRGIVLSSADLFMIPFSLIWGGMALVAFLGGNFPRGEPHNLFSFVITGFLFVIGLYFIVGRFWYDSWRRKKTTYGITNERVVIQSGAIKRRLKSLNLRTPSDITLNSERDDTGTILLGPQVTWHSWQRSFAWPGMSEPSPVFESVKEAKRVFDILRQAQKES